MSLTFYLSQLAVPYMPKIGKDITSLMKTFCKWSFKMQLTKFRLLFNSQSLAEFCYRYQVWSMYYDFWELD